MERAVMAHNRGRAERKGGFALMGFYQSYRCCREGCETVESTG
jgi:hypothetical protein